MEMNRMGKNAKLNQHGFDILNAILNIFEEEKDT